MSVPEINISEKMMVCPLYAICAARRHALMDYRDQLFDRL